MGESKTTLTLRGGRGGKITVFHFHVQQTIQLTPQCMCAVKRFTCCFLGAFGRPRPNRAARKAVAARMSRGNAFHFHCALLGDNSTQIRLSGGDISFCIRAIALSAGGMVFAGLLEGGRSFTASIPAYCIPVEPGTGEILAQALNNLAPSAMLSVRARPLSRRCRFTRRNRLPVSPARPTSRTPTYGRPLGLRTKA